MSTPRSILVTGATGLIGRRVVWSLLRRTSAPIVVLVRDPATGGSPGTVVAIDQVAGLIDEVAPLGTCDVVQSLAAPLPAMMLSRSETERSEGTPRMSRCHS